MASLPYPRTPLSPGLHPSFPRLPPLSQACPPSFPRLYPSFFRFTLFFSLFTPSLFLFILPTFVIRIDRRRCSYRPTQTSAPTDADIRTDRRRCSYRPTRMTFVDVSQCQTFTFTKRSVQLVYGRALTKTDKTPYCGQNPFIGAASCT